MPFSIDLSIGLYNSLYYRTSRDHACAMSVFQLKTCISLRCNQYTNVIARRSK